MQNFLRFFLRAAALIGLLSTTPLALSQSLQTDFLDPEAAFKLSVSRDGNTLKLRYQIAPGYYMYREQQAVTSQPADAIAAPVLPEGVKKFDPNFDKVVETWRDTIDISAAIKHAADTPFTVSVRSQGCADAGICYPPQTQVFEVNGNAVVAMVKPSNAVPSTAFTANSKATAAASAPPTSGLLWALSFFGLGLLLAFTPCVLPMLPILASIIVGAPQNSGQPTPRRTLWALGMSYLFGMAVVYTALGVAAGLAGQSLSFALQHPAVIAVMVLLMLAMALALFGVYELRLPNALANRINDSQSKLTGGRIGGVMLMGAFAAVAVSPCVSAPLVAAMTAIAQRGEVFTGGLALFALSIGMGLPLVLAVIFGANVLPKAGHWMTTLQRLMGFGLVAVALWLGQSLLSASWLSVLAAVWLLALVAYVWYAIIKPATSALGFTLSTATASAAVLWAALLLIGVARGTPDLLTPLSANTPSVSQSSADNSNTQAQSQQGKASFSTVRDATQLQAAIASAAAQGKQSMVYATADWCVSCKEFEKFTLSNADVNTAIKPLNKLLLDVTEMNAAQRELLKQYQLFGPPALLFFDRAGQWQRDKTLAGLVNAKQLIRHVESL